jgi:2-oxoisovalerate dehydrogenase E1 component alpha subunit
MHAERHIIDRGAAFGIPGEVVDGNEPVASWHALDRGMRYCRSQRRPYIIEAMVSRLYGHSSSSGALRVKDQPDCIELFQRSLLSAGILDQALIEHIHEEAKAEAEAALEQALTEPKPTPSDVEKFTYADSPVDTVYPCDYTGLPR